MTISKSIVLVYLGDLLAKQVVEFADKEKVSVSTTKNLKDFAHNLAAIQDYRDAEVRLRLHLFPY